jgi:RHS repeat-associated protein
VGQAGYEYQFRVRAADRVGNLGEWVTGSPAAVQNVTIYYYAGSVRVAMRQGERVTYLLADHLGSTQVTADEQGSELGRYLYTAWGETRQVSGETATDRLYTGQRQEAEIGLYYYNARWYDPALGRFTQADTIVPEARQGVLAWDRYAYVNNNPINYNDPNGHVLECGYTTDMHCGKGSGPILPVPIIQAPEEALDNVWGITEGIYSFIFDPIDIILTARDCLLESCTPVMLFGLVSPVIPGSKIDDIIKLSGQSHHVFSNKILTALNNHDILRDMFSRNDMLVQAIDAANHRGYQYWHRMYDADIVKWLENNRTLGTEEFLEYLRSVYEKPEMQKRFPDAWLLILMAIEELTR